MSGASLLDKIREEQPRRPESGDTVRRRRWGVALTGVVGTVLLGFALTQDPGSSLFYVATISTAITWIIGSLCSGPLHLGRREVLPALVLAAVTFAFFWLGAQVALQIPFLRDALADATSYADASLVFVVGVAWLSAVGEEMYFRGAVYSAIKRHNPIIWSTVAYMVATVATQNAALVLAAGAVGLLFGLQRKVSRGVLAPVLTHAAWMTTMILFLPRPA